MEQQTIDIQKEVDRKQSIIIAIAIGVIVVFLVMAIILDSVFPLIFAAGLEIILRVIGGLVNVRGTTKEDKTREMEVNPENIRQF